MKLRNRALLWVLALALGSTLLVASFSNVNWTGFWSEMGGLNPWWLLAALAANGLIVVLWSTQWRILLPGSHTIGARRMFEIVSLMAMIANTIPYMVGQASGVVLLARRGRVGHAVALSVLALEQVAEGMAKLSLLLLVAAFIPLPAWLATGLMAMVGAVVAGLVILMIMAHTHRNTPSPLQQSHSLTDRMGHFATRWAHNLEALRNFKKSFGALLLALGMKAAEAAAIFAIQRSFGIHLPLWSVLLVLASLGLATMVSLAPANLGVYEATVFVAYQIAGASPEQALSLALVQHVCYLVPMVGLGYLSLVTGNVGLGKKILPALRELIPAED